MKAGNRGKPSRWRRNFTEAAEMSKSDILHALAGRPAAVVNNPSSYRYMELCSVLPHHPEAFWIPVMFPDGPCTIASRNLTYLEA